MEFPKAEKNKNCLRDFPATESPANSSNSTERTGRVPSNQIFIIIISMHSMP